MRERPLLGHVLDVARKKHSPAAPILARSNRHTTAENLEDHIKSPMNCTILCSNLENSPPKSPNTSWSHLKSSKFIWNLGKMPEKYQLITSHENWLNLCLVFSHRATSTATSHRTGELVSEEASYTWPMCSSLPGDHCGFPSMGVPQARWMGYFMGKSLSINGWWLGVPPFQETSI